MATQNELRALEAQRIPFFSHQVVDKFRMPRVAQGVDIQSNDSIPKDRACIAHPPLSHSNSGQGITAYFKITAKHVLISICLKRHKSCLIIFRSFTLEWIGNKFNGY